MTSDDYVLARYDVYLKLDNILTTRPGPNHTIDILKECIKILQPYAEKEREKTHA